MIRGVSVDLSKTRTGVAVFLDGNLAAVDDVSFKDYSYFGEMLLAFKRTLPDWLEGAHWVAYEEVRPIHKLHMEQHFGMVGILSVWCFQRQVPLIGITSGAAKKRLTGKGNAKKPAMLEAAQLLYPEFSIDNHDQADAVAVGLSALDKMVVQEEPVPA